MTLGELIRKHRKAAGLTQVEAAAILSMSQSGYSKYERNATSPDPETLKLMAEAYGCTVSDLIGDTSTSDDSGEELSPQERELVGIYRRLGLEKQYRLLQVLLELERE